MNRIQTSTLPLPVGSKDKAKDWQLEILMEKLRSKASQYKTLPEISKNVRMTLLEKRYALDSVEKSQHQKCLDTLQHSIKVTSLQSMVERLESLTRQLGLKFVVEPARVFIHSDMFYLEIVLDPSGAVKDVKIHHEGKSEQQSCMELVNCLSRGDFTDFTAQLEGFTSIYQLNAEKKVKCKAFTALESLEADLSTLAQLQLFMKEPFNFVHKSPVGILEKRKGGHPMKLTYFVSPYDLISIEKGDIDPINIETVISKSLGYSVTVCMEGAAAHKLQTSTLLTVNRSVNGKSTPSYVSLTSQNSAVIPAYFVLKLNKPMPMCLSLVRQIQQLQQWTDIDNVPQQPLLNLIVTHCSEGKISSANNKGMFVTLPDQDHCYFMTENKNMDGVLVTNIPFTHPTHVPSILSILREQALFNTIISSCVRPNSNQDFENLTMFEVGALSSKHISVSLEHPIEESMATAEIDLSDISNLVCRVCDPSGAPDSASELACRVLNRSFSLPVTMRAVLKMWERQSIGRINHFGGHENFSLPLGSGDPGGHKDPAGNNLAEFGGLNDKIKQEPSGNGSHTMMMQANQGIFLNESMMASNFQNFPPSDEVLSNIELANILSDTPENTSSGSKGKRKVGTDDTEAMDSSDSTQSIHEIAEVTEELNSADKGEEGEEDEDAADIGDVHDSVAVKLKSRDLSPSRTVDLSGEKASVVPPNVSITPIPSSPSSGFSVIGGAIKDKRPSLDSIPTVPSSITITPITNTQSKSTSSSSSTEEKSKDKKSSKSSKDDKSKLDRKRKRKRDESPMGPPEKLPLKQHDPLTKPITVNITKSAESPPLTPTSTPTSPSMIKKFSSSPTSNRSSTVSGKLSPGLMKSGVKGGSSSTSSTHQSPKHSPAHVPSTPKHSLASISSPKHHGASPKHPSASGSGKPSMSTLKSAANSPSGKTSGGGGGGGVESKSSSKSSSCGGSSKEGSSGSGGSSGGTGGRDKEKKTSSSSSGSGAAGGAFAVGNSKNKGTSLKVKPLDPCSGADPASNTPLDNQQSPSGNNNDAKTSATQARNRKGSLSAIVDKLKVNAQHCDMATDLSSKSSSCGGSGGGGSGSSNRTDRAGSGAGVNVLTKACGSGDIKGGGSGKSGELKNSEYMVKPSSDGMKITINKTRSKESSSSSSSGVKSSSTSSGANKGSTSTGSPKVHTGLKPGVNSGPASKKPQQIQKSGGTTANSGYGGSSGNSGSGISNSGSGNMGGGSGGSSTGSTKISSGNLSGSGGSSTLSKSVSKFSGSPKTSSSATDLSRNKERLKPPRSNSEKSIFSSLKDRKSSPTPSRDEVDSIYRLSQATIMEGMMKSLDKNFQIPKLSARMTEDKKKSELNNVNRSTVDTKFFDAMAKNDLTINKYPLAISSSKLYENNVDQKLRNNVNNMNPINLGNKMIEDDDKKKDIPQNLSSSQGKDMSSYSEPLSLSTKSVDLTSKFAAVAVAATTPVSKLPCDDNLQMGSTTGTGAVSTALDYTKGSSGAAIQSSAASIPPSVSVHIVKSESTGRPGGGGAGTHVTPPCITDDELMDEALVGIGK